jgi:hypothetical protein
MSMLSKIIRKNKKGLLKVTSGLVGGVPIIGGAAKSIISNLGRGSPGSPAPYNPPGIQLPGGFSLDFPGMGRKGYGVMATGATRGRVAPGPNGECPKGYHLNKSGTADGAGPRTFCTRNRRTNFANGRAARRAGRRLKGTVRVLRKSFSLVAAKAPKGKWIPKGRGKR